MRYVFLSFFLLLSLSLTAMTPTEREQVRQSWLNRANILQNNEHYANARDEAAPAEEGIEQECIICFSEKNIEYFHVLKCGHKFCITCLQHMVDLAISEKTTIQLRCPSEECALPINEQDIKIITNNNKEIIDEIANIKLREWLSTYPNTKHCPTPDCPYAFIYEESCPQIINCLACLQNYCSECLHNHPAHILCQNGITPEERASNQWKQNNTKPCPRCGTRIEKDGGCNYVICTNCRLGFCYYCFENHHGTVCRIPPVEYVQPDAIWVPFDFERFQEEHQLYERIARLSRNLRNKFEAKLTRIPFLNAQLELFAQRLLAELERAENPPLMIIEPELLLKARKLQQNYRLPSLPQRKTLYDNLMGELQEVEILKIEQERDRVMILIGFNPDIPMDIYNNFIKHLNQLLHTYRPRPHSGIRKYIHAYRVLYTSTIDLEIFINMFENTKQHIF